MSRREPSTTEIYVVAVNSQKHYSIVPMKGEIPEGWNLAGKVGTRKECLAYIAQAMGSAESQGTASPDLESGSK